jgi:hypothetical protein
VAPDDETTNGFVTADNNTDPEDVGTIVTCDVVDVLTTSAAAFRLLVTGPEITPAP